jgi:hypothetical protein
MQILIDVLGWFGAALLVLAYGLVTARQLRPTGGVFQSLNLVGSLALMVNAASYSAWPSAALNLVWFSIGLISVVRSKVRRRPTQP